MKEKSAYNIIAVILVLAIAGFFAVKYQNHKQQGEVEKVYTTTDLKDVNEAKDSEAKPVETEVSLIAVGDIMLSRNVAANIKANGNDFNFPFQKITSEISNADITFANLECPITEGPVVKTGSMIFHADPGAEEGLKNAGIDIVSLANNHTPNYGIKGLLDTFKYLREQGIQFVGAGKDDTEAGSAVVVESKGFKFAFLGYNDADVVPANYFADTSHPETNQMLTSKLAGDIKKAKEQADFVIVSMHSGTEYKTPNPHQTEFAHAAIDAGAELVIGHHPHVLQEVEKYNGKYIFYSLGNFVFDQYFSKETSIGVITKTYFKKDGVSRIEFTPVTINKQSQPFVARDKQTEDEVLKQLNISSFTLQ
jgi:poly-gamma-glutamate synthesis protein (capsule biosynthesis protein)